MCRLSANKTNGVFDSQCHKCKGSVPQWFQFYYRCERSTKCAGTAIGQGSVWGWVRVASESGVRTAGREFYTAVSPQRLHVEDRDSSIFSAFCFCCFPLLLFRFFRLLFSIAFPRSFVRVHQGHLFTNSYIFLNIFFPFHFYFITWVPHYSRFMPISPWSSGCQV